MVFYIGYAVKIVNSTIVNNSAGFYLGSNNLSDRKVIVNTIFKNQGVELDGPSDLIATLENSYIDTNTTKIPNILLLQKNNIFSGVSLGFVNEADEKYRLLSSSGLIDKGVDAHNDVVIPTDDFDGNVRPVGISTDIGAFEYNADDNATKLRAALDDKHISFGVGSGDWFLYADGTLTHDTADGSDSGIPGVWTVTPHAKLVINLNGGEDMIFVFDDIPPVLGTIFTVSGAQNGTDAINVLQELP